MYRARNAIGNSKLPACTDWSLFPHFSCMDEPLLYIFYCHPEVKLNLIIELKTCSLDRSEICRGKSTFGNAHAIRVHLFCFISVITQFFMHTNRFSNSRFSQTINTNARASSTTSFLPVYYFLKSARCWKPLRFECRLSTFVYIFFSEVFAALLFYSLAILRGSS